MNKDMNVIDTLFNNEKTDVNLYSPENGNTPLIENPKTN